MAQDEELRTDYLRLKAVLYDPNTDLRAVPAVLDEVRAMFDVSRWVGVIHLEIDALARLESIYGWHVFDQLLGTVAEVLRRAPGSVVPESALAAQTGIYGGRFVVFLPLAETRRAPLETLDAAAADLAARLKERFGTAEFEAIAPPLSFHVGYSAFTSQPFLRLERIVYRAIEEARALGLHAEPHLRSRERAEMKRIIQDGDIEVVFQPVLDLDTSQVLGYEALSRGPRDTMFEKPMVMFACSRDAGVARELDLLCQRRALDRARGLSAGSKLFLNALPASLLDPGFRDQLLQDLARPRPVDPGDLVLEIADRDDIQDYELFGREVAELRDRGIRLAVDDVGTGPGSLRTIAEVRPEFIKLDGTLIRNLQSNLVKQEMLRSLCQVARSFEAVVVAEGIESEEELHAVRRCGVAYGQGFLLAAPEAEPPARVGRP